MDNIFRDIEEAEGNRKSFADKITSSKYDLDNLLSEFMSISMTFYEKGTSPEEQTKFPIKVLVTQLDGK